MDPAGGSFRTHVVVVMKCGPDLKAVVGQLHVGRFANLSDLLGKKG